MISACILGHICVYLYYYTCTSNVQTAADAVTCTISIRDNTTHKTPVSCSHELICSRTHTQTNKHTPSSFARVRTLSLPSLLFLYRFKARITYVGANGGICRAHAGATNTWRIGQTLDGVLAKQTLTYVCVCIYKHTPLQSNIHTYIHTHTCTQYINTRTNSHTLTHTHTYSNILTYTHTYTHSLSLSLTHTHTHSLTHTHTHTHTHKHTQTHTRTDTHARTHARTHTHTHMHTILYADKQIRNMDLHTHKHACMIRS